jgi:hypothetical protein
VQATIVLVPRRGRPGRYALLGAVVPAAALGTGVAVVQTARGGPHALALLAAFGGPILAAANLRRAPAAIALWLVAWLAHGLLAQGAAVGVIALATITIAELAQLAAPARSLAIGLLALSALDVVLVWGTSQVGPATTALHAAAVPTAAGHPVPRLQDATFGDATMGWLDLVAPALLGIIVRARLRAAVVTGVAAGTWGLLLLVTTTVPATVPVLAGLLTGRL